MKKKEKFFGLLGISTIGILLSIGICINGYANSALAATQTKVTTANTTVRVGNFCSMTATIQPGEQHSASLIGGHYKDSIGLTTIQTFCNDPNGYAIYAIGYTGGDAGVTGNYNTVLRSDTLGSTYDIVTGIATSGDISNWAMKLASVDGTYKPDILNGYDSYSLVPINYTKVADFSSNTDAIIGSSLTTTYAAYISPTQPAGTYEGQVKYVLVHPSYTLEPGTYYMQDVDEWGSQVAIGQEITVMDSRDNKSYTVRRMCMSGTLNQDGSDQVGVCDMEDSMLWMTQNLDLDLNKNTELTSEDTDLNIVDDRAYNTGYSQDSFGVVHWTPATTTITSIDTSTGKFNGWSNNNNVAYSADPDTGNPNNPWYATGEAYNSNLCYVSNNSQTCNYLNSSNAVAPTYFSHTAFTGNGNHGKIGNYYNWSAAIASSNSSSLTTSTYGNVANNPQNSICPKGWRLPTVSSVAANNEFARLNNVYNGGNTGNGNKLVQSPLYLVRSGYVSGGSLDNAGYNGLYWSSTVVNGSSAYYLNFRSSNVYPALDGSRNVGRSVRCVSDY